MDGIRGWVFTICGGALICGIASALIPSKSYEKAIQLLLGLFMLFCFLTPITGDWELPEISVSEAEQRRLEIAGQMEQIASEQLKSSLELRADEELAKLLSEYSIEPGDCSVSLAGDGEEAYALLRLPEKQRGRGLSIKNRLSTALGMPVELRYYV